MITRLEDHVADQAEARNVSIDILQISKEKEVRQLLLMGLNINETALTLNEVSAKEA